MPLYEYECTTCHRRTEKIQKYSDAELTVCPFCSGPLERTITAAAMVFKGGGWYADGYASHKKPASGEGSSSESGGSSDSGSGSGSGSVDNSSATLKASSGDSGTSESSKPTESSKPAAASPAPAAASSAKD